MQSVLALFTCFNRREKTRQAIQSLVSGNPDIRFTFLVVDDGSTDGTENMLQTEPFGAEVRVLKGDGSLFYSRGMGLGMSALLESKEEFDYLLMMNDDVAFFPGCIEALSRQSREKGDAVIVGATRDEEGKLSYSGILYEKGIRYRFLNPGEETEADTMNANCVLIPYALFRKTGTMDPHYHHSLGDFDYGFALRKAGGRLYVSEDFVGLCRDNPPEGTWYNKSLPRKERLRRKESVKGDPVGPWFYYLRKHFGLFAAVKSSVTPYLRILLGL